MIEWSDKMYMIKEMPSQERPREKMLQFGKQALSNVELIAIILRTGYQQKNVLELSKTIAYQKETLKDVALMSIEELCDIKGVGPSKAIQLLAAFELGKRTAQEVSKEQLVLSSPESIYSYIKHDIANQNQEHFIALFFTTKGALIKHETLFIGTLNSAVVHPRVLFKKAVLHSAASFVVCHNHPSGDPTPSQNDLKITKTIKENATMMAIVFMDHVIIGKDKYFSFKEKGLL
ncbi:MAG: DNA repair protein RadC [Candidatus Izimaplasma sp.]|nr:DNA repair protein RadC [Candidatus Izimaplasma bacterium]